MRSGFEARTASDPRVAASLPENDRATGKRNLDKSLTVDGDPGAGNGETSLESGERSCAESRLTGHASAGHGLARVGNPWRGSSRTSGSDVAAESVVVVDMHCPPGDGDAMGAQPQEGA